MNKNIIQLVLAFILGVIFILLLSLIFRGGMTISMMEQWGTNKELVPGNYDGNPPRIEFDKTEYDFGLISKSDGIVFTNFVVKNTGESNLIIKKITTSCGCTTAEISKKIILPGGAAILTVVFDPNFHKEPEGKFERIVFLETNDPFNPESEVKIFMEMTE